MPANTSQPTANASRTRSNEPPATLTPPEGSQRLKPALTGLRVTKKGAAWLRRVAKGTRRHLPPCPEPGWGVHEWFCKAAHYCYDCNMSESKAVGFIESRATRPPCPDWEIRDVVAIVYVDRWAEEP